MAMKLDGATKEMMINKKRRRGDGALGSFSEESEKNQQKSENKQEIRRRKTGVP